MTPPKKLQFDQIGYWSEIKLDIIREYAAAYSKILSAQERPTLCHIYIDAFAGAGIHKSKTSGTFVPGSPTNTLLVKPPFREYHFIDLDERKVASLGALAKKRDDVYIYHGDWNRILLERVAAAGQMGRVPPRTVRFRPLWPAPGLEGNRRSRTHEISEIFLNFPVADINRNVLWRDKEGVSAEQAQRLNRFWGDESWHDVAYKPSAQGRLFGAPEETKTSNAAVAEAFRKRLKNVAGFSNVPDPIAMRNKQNAVVYYLYFASHKPVAKDIVQHIFTKYREGGAA